jgi:hypothetical protein
MMMFLEVQMPLFSLTVRDGETWVASERGEAFPELSAARAEGIRVGREIFAERLLHGGPLDNCVIEISDEAGA